MTASCTQHETGWQPGNRHGSGAPVPAGGTGTGLSDHAGAKGPSKLRLCKGFTLGSGEHLPKVDIAFETYGSLNTDKTNAVLVCPCLTADHHVTASAADGSRGWWDWLVGPGRPIDTERFFVVSASLLGSCTGTTGPTSLDPVTGTRYGPTFPEVTIEDMASLHEKLLRALEIESVAAVIGGSIGGKQALAFGRLFPEYTRRVISVAAASTLSDQGVALNAIGRQAIEQDPDFNEGWYEPGAQPAAGLATARRVAHVSYLAREGMRTKFGGDRDRVASYLDYQGRKFVDRFDANSYLRLLGAMSAFDWEGPAPKSPPIDLISISSDWLYTPAEHERLDRRLRTAGVEGQHVRVRSEAGHDGFLTEEEGVGGALRALMERQATELPFAK